jgi:DNA polymerase-1
MQTGEHRRVAKMINFGIIYGLTAYGLATRLGIEPAEAQRYIDAYFQRYAGVKAFRERLLQETRQRGFTCTLFGRRRPIPEINAHNANQRNFAERTALNSPLQGTAADLIKLAMIGVFQKLKEAGLLSRLLSQIHDELLFEAPEKEVGILAGIVKSSMEGVFPLRVPLVANISVGSNWRDMKPFVLRQ